MDWFVPAGEKLAGANHVHSGPDGFVLERGYVNAWAELVGANARTATIPGAGHRIDEEAPGELAGLVSAFALAGERA